MAAVRRKMPLWVRYRPIVRPSSLPTVKRVEVEGGCIWMMVRLRGGGESLLFFLVSRRSFGSSEFIVVVVAFRLCNGSYYVYLTPIFGRVFKQEIFESIAYGCRVCGGTTNIKSGAGQVVLADLLPAAPALRRKWCAGSGAGAGNGGGRGVEVYGDGLRLGGTCSGSRGAPGASAHGVNQSLRTDYSVQHAVVRLCHHRGVGKNKGLVKYQGRCITDWDRNYCANNDYIW